MSGAGTARGGGERQEWFELSTVELEAGALPRAAPVPALVAQTFVCWLYPRLGSPEDTAVVPQERHSPCKEKKGVEALPALPPLHLP